MMTSIATRFTQSFRSIFSRYPDLESYRDAFETENRQMKFERNAETGKYRDPATEAAWGNWSKQRFLDDTQW